MAAGRPSKFKPEYIEQARKLCLLGSTDKQMADFFDVSEVTLNAWKQKHPEFLKSLKDSKKELDNKVVRSLFERATGYSHPDTKFATFEGEITDAKEFTKHYAPDPTACIFWLKNRQPEEWRDKQEIQHSGGVDMQFSDKSDEQIAKAIQDELAKRSK